MHDRPAGGQVVGGRSRWRRDDQAVGFDRGDELIAHRDFQLDHARQRRAREHDVVQRHVRDGRLRRRSVATARSIMRWSYDARPAITASSAVKISGPRDLGEEPKRAEVHAEDRHVVPALRDRLRHARAACRRRRARRRDRIVRESPSGRRTDREPEVKQLRGLRRPHGVHTAVAQPFLELDERVAGGQQARLDGNSYAHPVQALRCLSPHDLRCIKNSWLPLRAGDRRLDQPDALQSYFSGGAW